jgi:hypothetical protein
METESPGADALTLKEEESKWATEFNSTTPYTRPGSKGVFTLKLQWKNLIPLYPSTNTGPFPGVNVMFSILTFMS